MSDCPSCVSLRQQIAALRDYWREQMVTNGSTGESFEELLYSLDALLAPEASAPTQPVKVEHVCGLQGYCPGPPHYDPICPACAARFKASAPTTEQE
jgi:hypothetical protein